MKKITLCIASLLLASSVTPASSEAEQIKAALAKRFPDISIEEISPTPIAGIYEIATSTEIVYADASGEHLILGSLVSTATRENLTTARWNARHAIDFAKLPLDLAIRNVKGNGSRRVVVFADPDCPYCEKLERELESVPDVTVYTFLYPLESLHPGATAKSRNLWCTSDRATAWKDWMIRRQLPVAHASCASDPIEAIQKLADQYRISSTPTLVLADGRRVNGMVPAEQIEKLLQVPAAVGSAAASGK